MEFLAIILFLLIFLLILLGFPVAFTLAGVSALFGLVVSVFNPYIFALNDFSLLPSRFMGTLNNTVLMAVPLFIFMGIMLEKSGLAETMLETMATVFGRLRGGLAISVLVVGALLAASTGIVGATVVTMGSISLPTMLKHKYAPSVASGVIASAGTLGQIIPPSVVLILLADTISSSSGGRSGVDVGSLFSAALMPGLILVLLYITYILLVGVLAKTKLPAVENYEKSEGFRSKVIVAFILPLLLIVSVLGSIFFGIATPTEAAAVGAVGATILTTVQGKFSWPTLKNVMQRTGHLTAMVFWILLGATTFTLVFRTLGGDRFLVELITQANLSTAMFLVIVMTVIFVAGFFIDFIEIIFIFVPVLTPIFLTLEVDLLWIAILIALNLQTSFLTPPFGFSLFYLKGVAPPGVETKDIYRGVVPFIAIQLAFIIVLICYPDIIYLWQFNG